MTGFEQRTSGVDSDVKPENLGSNPDISKFARQLFIVWIRKRPEIAILNASKRLKN